MISTEPFFPMLGWQTREAVMRAEIEQLRSALASHTVASVEELEALPIGTIVMSAAGTVACRFDEAQFVCLGDERPGSPWSSLRLPVRVLYVGEGHRG